VSKRPLAGSAREPVSSHADAGSASLLVALFLLMTALSYSVAVQAAASSATVTHRAVTRYADGAPVGFSGGFKEDSCQACHFGADVNATPGKVDVSGVPERFRPGERYLVTITLTRPGIALGGFQLTVRVKNGGKQAGALAPAPGEEKRVRVDAQGRIQYAGQRQGGTAPVAGDTARWTVDWTAPKTGGAVLFHVAANASNKDDTAEGDYIYTAIVETAAQR
jgi:cytochrome c5